MKAVECYYIIPIAPANSKSNSEHGASRRTTIKAKNNKTVTATLLVLFYYPGKLLILLSCTFLRPAFRRTSSSLTKLKKYL